MIFIIPIVIGALALVTGGVGVAAGADGLSKMDDAKGIGENAKKKYENKKQKTEIIIEETNNLAKEYGETQIEIQLKTVKRFVDFIERIGQNVSPSDLKFLEGFDGFSPETLEEYKLEVLKAEKIATGGATAIGAGYATGQGAIALAGLFGTASTGTAIGGLSGAAAWNATLAWLGGGSLASGGGGMALGSVMLGGIAVAPALIVTGFILGGQGEKALTKAIEYRAKVNVEIERLDSLDNFLGQVQTRIKELENLVNSLNQLAVQSLSELESRVFVCDGFLIRSENINLEKVDFIPERDAPQFQKVYLLIKALVEILKTPVLDSTGNLNEPTFNIKEKYRNLKKK